MHYLTPEIPGIGGVLKERPEDFLVEEIPAFNPVGHGEHVYLFVQKKGLATSQLIAILARHFNVDESAIGVAGLKDRQAITRQVVSIHTPGKTPEDFPSLRDERIEILWSDLHTSKLKRGMLAGNRFSIRIRHCPIGIRGVFPALKVLRTLEAQGVPNRVGPQRFGMLQNNHLIGFALAKGDYQRASELLLFPQPPSADGPVITSESIARARSLAQQGYFNEAAELFGAALPVEHKACKALARCISNAPEPGPAALAQMRPSGWKQAWQAIPELQKGFYFSAMQSAIFNNVLDQRLASGTFSTLLDDDLVWDHQTHALLQTVPNAPTLQQQVASVEVSPTGPMWGPEMKLPRGDVLEREKAALASAGLSETDLVSAQEIAPFRGERRPLRVPIRYVDVEAGVDENGTFIRTGFELPPGSFATVVLEEVMKLAERTTTGEATEAEQH